VRASLHRSSARRLLDTSIVNCRTTTAMAWSGSRYAPDRMARVFLLSPANCGGRRASQIVSDASTFALAQQLRSSEGAPLGDVFSFMSGLYFRGKLAYARRFAAPPDPGEALTAGGVLVITPNAGLRGADVAVTREAIRAFAAESIELANVKYRRPLERSAHALLASVGPDCDVVLLGSVASGKYVDILEPIFGERLLFPSSFVGRGDMSRGGLMLQCVRNGVELDYVPVAGAVRHGRRPPKLCRHFPRRSATMVRH
jgi:hypothetical protein